MSEHMCVLKWKWRQIFGSRSVGSIILLTNLFPWLTTWAVGGTTILFYVWAFCGASGLELSSGDSSFNPQLGISSVVDFSFVLTTNKVGNLPPPPPPCLSIPNVQWIPWVLDTNHPKSHLQLPRYWAFFNHFEYIRDPGLRTNLVLLLVMVPHRVHLSYIQIGFHKPISLRLAMVIWTLMWCLYLTFDVNFKSKVSRDIFILTLKLNVNWYIHWNLKCHLNVTCLVVRVISISKYKLMCDLLSSHITLRVNF